jgi:CRP/FNR family transcriptional regulator, cyclic AMP receptor protein
MAQNDCATPEDRPTVIRLLDVVPQLSEHLSAAQADAARSEVVAPVLEVRRGAWPRETMSMREHHPFGAIVASGLLARTVDIGGYPGLDVYGAGDVVSARELHPSTLPCGESWTATVSARLAILDDRFLVAARRWPRLVSALVGLLGEQRDRLMLQLVIAQQPRVEDRLLMLFWQLSDRFGRVTADGIAIRLALTHEALGRLIGARRPTVTLALRMLCERGALERRPDRSWLVKELPQDTAVTAAVPSDGVLPRPLEETSAVAPTT